ncbi:MAG: HAD hydrolase family protein [Candidatus Gastranaerophilales bacterium]|jgi:3-deoxy-D-manno-octulosonate 8-phosphate phosphatase (KDO 8-P phosphatase)|nr:HAD hydrolase family protein [Candidatus Gastranaerophilales bacterium]
MLKLSKDIKFIVSDFDGVFTDGSVYISEKNEVQKKLNFKDIMGVSMLLKKGYNFAIISGEKSNILNYFKDKFGIEEIHGGIRQKGITLDEIMKKYNLSPDEVLYIGDDINDISAMELVKFRIAPRNVNPILTVKVPNLQITEAYGGNGAIREIADILAGDN